MLVRSETQRTLRSCDETIAIDRLFQLYSILRRFITGKKIPTSFLKTSWGLKHFETLRSNIIKYQQETGLIVDPVLYIKSHFLVFGENTYPTHLISKTSFDIYRKYREKVKANIVKDVSSVESELDLLRYLATTRKESIEETFQLVRHSGLFTEQFINWYENQ